jgi:plasmid stabilization system protein ParE
MKYEVVLLQSAKQDLHELRAYQLKQFGREAWLESYVKIKAVIEVLKTFPFSGVVPDELESINLAQFRQILSGKNRIIYEVRQNVVYVHLIADSRRDMKSLLMRRILRAGA